jgi:hypothetical protein
VMNDISNVLDTLERQDFHALLTKGLPDEISNQIGNFCKEYRSTSLELRSALKSKVSRKTTAVMLLFVRDMAKLAMRQKDRERVDLGLIALDLSNIANVDWRDALAPASQLAFAAKQCNIDVVDRARKVIPDLPSILEEMLKHPKVPHLTKEH